MSPVDEKPQTDKDAEAPDTEQAQAQAKRNREGTILALLFAGALLATTYPLPYRVFAGVFALIALVWAVRYFIAGARAKQGGNWIVLGIIAVIGCLYLVLTTLGTLAVWPVQEEYEQCLRQAITQEALVGCTSDYDAGLQGWFEQITGQPYPG